MSVRFGWISWLILACPGLLRADLVIEVRDADVMLNQPAIVEVYVSSESGQNIDLFQYKFAISPTSESVGILRFRENQNNSELLDNDYIHYNNSALFISQGQNGPAFDQVLGGDATETGTGTDVQGSLLLARLEIEYSLPEGTPDSAAASDLFFISLVRDEDTFFYNSALSPVEYSSLAGAVRLNIVATPEPTSLFLIGLGATGVISIVRRLKRSHKPGLPMK